MTKIRETLELLSYAPRKIGPGERPLSLARGRQARGAEEPEGGGAMNKTPWYKVLWCWLAHHRWECEAWAGVIYYTCPTCGRRWDDGGGE